VGRGGVVGKEVGLIPRAGKLNTSDDEANKDEITPPPHPNASGRKGERETSKGNVTMAVFFFGILFNDNFSC